MNALDAKEEAVKGLLRAAGGAAVAFSGGADSTLLLDLAREALGGRALAITVDSPILPRRELSAAQALAASLGVRHMVAPGREMSIPDFVSNLSRRCYFCKKSHLSDMMEAARDLGLTVLFHGANADDPADHRPGLLAARELGVRAPLAEAGLSKAEVRELSRRRGLSTWNKPSSACLASRIPHGSPVTALKLAAIEAAEDFLHDQGLSQLRVRHHGDTARVEVTECDMPRFLDPAFRERAAAFLEGLGFRHSALDLRGYRTGSLNPDGPAPAPSKDNQRKTK